MIARQVVDIIQIAGLVVGAMGVFYLSQGLFGAVGNDILRQLLVAIPFGVFGAVAQPLAVAADPNIVTLGIPAGLLWLEGFVVFFAFGLLLTSKRFSTLLAGYPVILIVGMALVVFVLIFGIRLLFNHVPALNALEEAGLDGATYLGLFLVPKIGSSLSDRQLQISGLFLTLSGVAMQFVPPTLDLLNVKIA